jgi:hypothetical protein
MRRVEDLEAFKQSVEARKKELGVTAEDFVRPRNSGRRRTREKREFLARIQERARDRGLDPLPAKF